MTYILESNRLGFRAWGPSDLGSFAAMNNDPEVMKYFPQLISRHQSQSAIERFVAHQERLGYCYFAVELLETKQFIGFIGLMQQQYPFVGHHVVDIGWRLIRSVWRQGLASEGAKRCLDFAKDDLKLASVFAVAPRANIGSIGVMKKIGMSFGGQFDFDRIPAGSSLNPCVYYKIDLT